MFLLRHAGFTVSNKYACLNIYIPLMTTTLKSTQPEMDTSKWKTKVTYVILAIEETPPTDC